MPLSDIDRKEVEESILDAQTACELYLDGIEPSAEDTIHTVVKMLSVLEKHKDDLRSEDLGVNYKMHAMIPLQTMYMLTDKEDDSE